MNNFLDFDFDLGNENSGAKNRTAAMPSPKSIMKSSTSKTTSRGTSTKATQSSSCIPTPPLKRNVQKAPLRQLSCARMNGAESPIPGPSAVTLHQRRRKFQREQRKLGITNAAAAASSARGSPFEEVEFENLPPAIRRKYFSSLERLRLAQAANKPGSTRAQRRKMSMIRLPMHRSTQSIDASRQEEFCQNRGKLRKPRPSTDAFIMSQVDAEWFLNLPETIKRKHFTREEQLLLTASAGVTRCRSIIVDAAEETLLRLKKSSNNSKVSIATHSSMDAETETTERSKEIDQSFRWMEDEGSLELKLDDYHKSLKETDKQARPRRLSFRKTLAIPVKHGKSESIAVSSTAPKSSSSSRRQSLSIIGRRGMSQSISFSRQTPSPFHISSESEPTPTYYQDPEARLKLRVYLASPQKFDEAVEFGFPASTPDPARSRPETAATVRKVDETYYQERSFLINDDKGACEEMEVPPHVRVEEALDTGDLPEKVPHMLSNRSWENYDLNGTRPSLSTARPRTLGDHYPHVSASNREMTLRMTLTRPDLRADEKLLYGWQEDRKSASSGDLGPFFDGNWNELKKDSDLNLVKKMWRKVARR